MRFLTDARGERWHKRKKGLDCCRSVRRLVHSTREEVEYDALRNVNKDVVDYTYLQQSVLREIFNLQRSCLTYIKRRGSRQTNTVLCKKKKQVPIISTYWKFKCSNGIVQYDNRAR